MKLAQKYVALWYHTSSTYVLFSYHTEPVRDSIAISDELELRPREIGEIIVSGWHVNTFQVTFLMRGDIHLSSLRFSALTYKYKEYAPVVYKYRLL